MAEQQITTVDELVRLIGVPLPRVANKVRSTLHELDRQWLAAVTVLFGGDGRRDGGTRRVAQVRSARATRVRDQ